jgi:hypothetical protein
MSDDTSKNVRIDDSGKDPAGENPQDKGAGQDEPPREIGGRNGPDPTRFGDWEKNGRCIDF